MRHTSSVPRPDSTISSIRVPAPTANFLDFGLGLRKSVSEEWDRFSIFMSRSYESILREGRNNNSDLAVRIREYTDSVIEFIESLQNKKFF